MRRDEFGFDPEEHAIWLRQCIAAIMRVPEEYLASSDRKEEEEHEHQDD